MSAPLTAADGRLAMARRNIQKILHGRVDDATQRIYRDGSFFTDANVIPIRAGVIGDIVHSAQQLLVTEFNDRLSRQLGLASAPRVSPQVFERPGVDKTTEYSRPFYTALQLVRGGKSETEALNGGGNRLRIMTATDLQMAKVRQARIALKAGGRRTFRRVTTSDKPCELCDLASDQIYYTGDLMPIHPNCSCDVEADEDSAGDSGDRQADDEDTSEPDDRADESDTEDKPRTVDDIAVREHGEIGPLLTWLTDKFTGPEDLPSPPEIVASPSGGQAKGPGIPESIYDRARAHLNALNIQMTYHAS